MYAAIAVFAFNRPLHLKKTIDALSKNDLAEETDLIIYCDGPRSSGDLQKVEAVHKVAECSLGFRSVSVYKREKNFGLARSIIQGIDAAFVHHERIIVMEDDLVTSPYFLRYMNDGLELYADNPKVASIHGWCFPHGEKTPPSTFFLRGADCWGWATWRRAWDFFEPDANLLLHSLRKRNLEHLFNISGTYDYIGMLERVVRGENDSWAVRWMASAFLADMYTLYSSTSLVSNIGVDGTGTNTGKSNIFDVPLAVAPIVIERQDVSENKQMHKAFQDFNKKLGCPPSGAGWGGIPLHTTLKSIAKEWLPPVVTRLLKKCLNRVETPAPEQESASVAGGNIWQPGYSDWQSACAASEGYDSQAIFAKVRDASRAVRDGKAVFERDSVLFDRIEYSWPLLAGLMWGAARHGGRLNIIDFGGSLGSGYRQNRHFLRDLREVRWNVVEQKHFVQCGREEFQTDQLRFYETIESCLESGAVDGIVLSSVLQYIEDPYALLEKVCAYGFDFILIDRTPFSEGTDSIMVQHVPEAIYKASYPCHFLDRKRLEAILAKHYFIEEWFDDALGGPGWYGLIARQK